jgi:hypothetical protein
MKKALFLTAFNRPSYLQQTLESWLTVRGIEDWRVVFMIEPSHVTGKVVEICERFIEMRDLKDAEVCVNPQVYGVLHHPWVGFERLLMMHGYDFAVRAEDDLLVSSDVLEYFDWAASEYKGDADVAAVQAYTDGSGPEDGVARVPRFNPWVWGTWRDRWHAFIGPTWDHDYSTYNGYPGNQSGWDWNLDTRLYPLHGLRSVAPLASRVDNIGVHGVHGTPDNHRTSLSFERDRPQMGYRETVDSTQR